MHTMPTPTSMQLPLTAHTPPRLRLVSSAPSRSCLLFALFVGLLSLLSPPLVSGQQVRIPLKRKDVAPGHHYRSVHALAQHAANGFQGALPSSHHELQMLYSDPRRIVQLKNFYNRMYTGEVVVGTPAVSYSLVFDTGSADMWLFAAQSEKPRLDYVQYYDASKSTTSKPTTTPWSIQYGKGASKGVLVRDRVQLAGLAANDFLFAQATTYSDDFESPEMPLDGLLGLAFAPVNSAEGPTLLDALQTAGLIKERVFSFYLTDRNPEGSEFVLGAPDTSLMRGNITYFDLASTSGMWLLAMQAVNVGGSTTPYCSTTSDCPVLLDTGTSFIGMPSTAFQDFARRVNSVRPDCLVDSRSGLLRCDNNTPERLPSISFSVQGSLFTLEGADYFQDGVLGLMSIDFGQTGRSNFWILGDTFLIKYFTVYDMDAKRIGIAGAKPGVPYTPPSKDDEPLESFGWELIVLIIGILLGAGLLLFCCLRCCCNSSRKEREPVAAPYVLHSGPPAFQSQRYQQQPGGYPSSAHGMSFAPVAYGQPIQQPRSEFARDFYAARPSYA